MDEYKIKTTWFFVGKIFEKYPETVDEIINRGHEIGSHTFNHISPLYNSGKVLEEDFKLFSNIRYKNVLIKGFHSPRSLWSIRMFKHLKKYDFLYDVVHSKSNKHREINSINFGKKIMIK